MKHAKPGDAYADTFTTVNAANVPTNADATPAGTVYLNGTAQPGTAVTVAAVSGKTGQYRATFTHSAGWSHGNHVGVLIEAVIGGTTYTCWLEDVTLVTHSTNTLPSAAANGAGGLHTIGSGTGQFNVSGGLVYADKRAHMGVTALGERLASGTFPLPASNTTVTLYLAATSTVPAEYVGAKIRVYSNDGAGNEGWELPTRVTSVAIVPVGGNDYLVATVSPALVRTPTTSSDWVVEFERVLLDAGGAVTVGTNNDKANYSLSAAGVSAVWAALVAGITTANSIGKRIIDFLDVAVGSRLAPTTAGRTLNVSAGGVVDDTAGTTTLLTRVTGTLTTAAQDTLDVANLLAAIQAVPGLTWAYTAASRTLGADTVVAASVKAVLLPFIRLMLRKDPAPAADHASELGEINADTGTGAGTFASTSDSQESIRDNLGAGGGGGEGVVKNLRSDIRTSRSSS